MKNLTGSQISGGGHFLADSKCLGPLGETVCKDKTFYIIAYNGGIGGLFAIYYQILWHIIYAFDNGYIPVVDMQHYYNQYFKDNRIYKDNSWEYYFKQPCNISLNDLTEDCNIIISKDDDINEGLSFESFLRDIDESRKKYKKYFNVIKFQDEIEAYLNKCCEEITGGDYNILGILCRGTDYVKNHPYAHPVQPKTEDVIKKAKELIKRFNYKRIWLATEDLEIYNMFKKEFGDLIIENKQYKFGNTDNQWLADIKVHRENHNYKLGKEYLLTIYILSKCKYIIGGRTAGIAGSWLLSNGFANQKYVYIWNLGLYNYYNRPLEYSNIFEKIFSVKKCRFENKKYLFVTICGLKVKILREIVESYDKEYYNPSI